MPEAAKRPCKQMMCPGLAGRGKQYCPGHQDLERAAIARRQAWRPSKEKRKWAGGATYDSRWQKLRRMKLRMNPLCECGCLRQADTVHHIVPVEDQPELLLDFDNLMSLTNECHERHHGRKK